MKRYLLYVSQLYSLSIMRPLQQVIRRRGDDCAWFFDQTAMGEAHLRKDEKQLKTPAEVKAYNPGAVFVPGNLVPDFFPGLKVQIFHGLATDDTGKKGHYRIRGFFDLYCTRGPEETANFQALAERYGSFRVVETGWPKLDPLFAGGEELALPLQLTGDKPLILYASTFSPSLTSAPALFETIRTLSRSGEWHWLVTLHPKMAPALVEKYRGLAGPDVSFFESHQDVLPLLKAADVMLCDTSSIAIEFQMLHKPLVTFRNRRPCPQHLNVTEVAEVYPALTRALSCPPELMARTTDFVRKLHPLTDGQSSERVLAATDRLSDDGMAQLRRKPLNLWRKFQIRKRLGYYRFS
jgi:CDP-glycerol glycerophosphotransferase (TagB/SpsB family)